MGPKPERPPAWRPPYPWPVPIRTARLLIDWYREDDAASLYRTIDAHREALGRWLPWPARDHRSEEESLDRIRVFRKERSQAHPANLVLAVFEPAFRTLLGGTGFHGIDAEAGKAEIGYWIRPDRHGEGLCTEATAAVVHAGFTDFAFRRITVRMDARNTASRRVAEKVGFRHEHTLCEVEWKDGVGWTDELGFALLAREWDPAARRARP